MEKKKILMLTILLIAIVGITVSTVNAKTYTKTVQFKESKYAPLNKYIGHNNYVSTFYNSKYSAQLERSRAVLITIGNINEPGDDSYYNLVKAKVKYTKKVNGKTKTYFKTYKPNKWGYILTSAPKGWKPYSAFVTYKD